MQSITTYEVINKLKIQNLGGKTMETITSKKGNFKVEFNPNEWKIIAIS